jgi:hypothetical protein
MNDVLNEAPAAAACANHPSRETYVRCSKCAKPICPKCMVPTPVGARCAQCANLRRLPQYDLDPLVLVRGIGAGLAVSAAGWFFLTYVPVFRFFVAFFLGAAVGHAMSAAAKRRTNWAMQAGAVLAIGGGWLIAEFARASMTGSRVFNTLLHSNGAALSVGLPLALAAYIAITRLR